MIKNLSNANREELAQRAYDTFAHHQELAIHVNRSRSYAYQSSATIESPFNISPETRNYCLAHVTQKTEEWASWFFSDLEGNTCYMDQTVMDRFTNITRQRFPNLQFTCLFAVVDKETGIELMPEEMALGYLTSEDENVFIDFKARAYIAKLIN